MLYNRSKSMLFMVERRWHLPSKAFIWTPWGKGLFHPFINSYKNIYILLKHWERERNDLKSIKIKFHFMTTLPISDSVQNHTPHTESPLQYFKLAPHARNWAILSLIMDAVRLFTFSTLVLDIEKKKKKEAYVALWQCMEAEGRTLDWTLWD